MADGRWPMTERIACTEGDDGIAAQVKVKG
jgi:hypothetical protein